MGSVSEYHKCPNCISEECFTDFLYKSGEEFTTCSDCGYCRYHRLKRDEKGECVKDEKDDYVFESNELKNPFGAYCAKNKDAKGYECGSFENEAEFKNFEKYVKNAPHIEFACISQFINGEIKRTAIVGDLNQRFAN